MSLAGLGPRSGTGYLTSFATGVLATVVAAPCTAPFMGAAVGFALTQTTMISLLIFGALGAGMAVPYLLLCYSPVLLAKLPAPGRWMEKLKEVMAFPMFASAIWLLWVLGLQTSPTGMMQVLAGLLLLGLAVWALNSESRTGKFVAVASILGAVYLVIGLEVSEPDAMMMVDSSEARQPQGFEMYDRRTLADAQQRGPVFVNFTAAWCITCKVNEANALNTELVREAMAEYGRSGVPLYLLYRQGAERAEVLPQMLTKSIVIDALNGL